ncbi:recombinase family protein [Polymorphum gilvum]|uniref:recombinase family protein n=1 Tax=Polymorphum gilvum TaxID=991904 RepID=UPI00059D2C9D|nr:recombinase family protein [Polymorphum gilvum]
MIFGYARVSKIEGQDTAAQIAALKAAGADTIFEDAASGGRYNRPALQKLLESVQPGDVVIVWKLDRLSRSLMDLLRIMERLDAAAAGFRSLTEAIDTTTPAGRMMMQMLGSVAEFEREMIRERTRAGLAHAREQGRRLGRRRALTRDQQHAVHKLLREGQSQADIARLFNVHRSTISRFVTISVEAAVFKKSPRSR